MAKTRAFGSDARFIGVKETTAGTPPDGSGGSTYRALRLRRLTLGERQPLQRDPLLGLGRDALDPYDGPRDVQGEADVPILDQEIGWWLTRLFGAPVTTGPSGSDYTHVWTSGGDLATFAFEAGHPKLVTPEYFMYDYVKAGGASGNLDPNNPASMVIPLLARKETPAGASEDAAPVSYTNARFSNARSTVKVGGNAVDITGATFSLSNNLEQLRVIRADQQFASVDEGEFTASGSITTATPGPAAIEAAVAARTPIALVYEWTKAAGAHKLSLSFPRVFLPREPREIPGPGGLFKTYNWEASAEGAPGLTVTLINTVSAYV